MREGGRRKGERGKEGGSKEERGEKEGKMESREKERVKDERKEGGAERGKEETGGMLGKRAFVEHQFGSERLWAHHTQARQPPWLSTGSLILPVPVREHFSAT